MTVNQNVDKQIQENMLSILSMLVLLAKIVADNKKLPYADKKGIASEQARLRYMIGDLVLKYVSKYGKIKVD
jgi:hypothetical protein